MGAAGDDAPDSLTRRFATARGELTYAELADTIAPFLERLLDRIADGGFTGRPISDDLIREFHRAILGEVVPDIAGVWRTEQVQVGHYEPPEYFRVPVLMREFADNLQARLEHAESLQLQIELLAYAEGEFLRVHPFADFNGRTVRALLSELLVRLDFPPIEVSVRRDTDEFRDYRDALAAYDNGDIALLIEFWYQRFDMGVSS